MTFQPKQKVVNQYGEKLTVLRQVSDCEVLVVEQPHTHYHPTKLFKV